MRLLAVCLRARLCALYPVYAKVELLGQGTFGQVVKCEDLATKQFKAVKVIKNKPAYYNQAQIEVKILKLVRCFAFFEAWLFLIVVLVVVCV